MPGGGLLSVPDTYTRTTTADRIVYVASNGNYYSRPSSRRYKTEIQDYEPQEILQKFLNLRPVTFKYNYEVNEVGLEKAGISVGLIAEEVAEAGLTEFVVYARDPESNFILDESDNLMPDNVTYPELTVGLISVLKVQDQIIKNLESRLSSLESRITALESS